MNSRLLALAVGFALLVSSNQAFGDLILLLDDTPSGVRLEYSGSLDVSGLSFSSITGSIVTVGLRANDEIVYVPNDGLAKRSFDDPFQQFPSDDFFTQNTVGAGVLVSGSTLRLDGGPDLTSGPLILAESDIASDVWSGNGFMQFGNATTLASIGALEGRYEWTLNNATGDSIVLTIGDAVAVPEPSSVVLLGAGIAFCAISSGRRSRNMLSQEQKKPEPSDEHGVADKAFAS